MCIDLRRSLPLLAVNAILIFFSGCSSPYMSMQPTTPYGGATSDVSGITVVTRDRTTLQYQEDAWRLTPDGIAGTASIRLADGTTFEKDTTLSYVQVSAVETTSGRGSTMTQFLLTILGVILVLGLAAIILYAAFRATDR